MGVLTRESPPTNKQNEKILQLFGRQKYPQGSQYEYYAIMPITNIKLHVHNKNRNELFDGDTVFLKELNATYKVTLYKMERLEYNPYII